MNKKQQHLWSFLMPFLCAYKARVALALASLLFAALSTLSLPYVARHFLDKGIISHNPTLLHFYAALLIFNAFALGVMSAARFYCVTWIAERVTLDIEKHSYNILVHTLPSFFENIAVSDVVTRLTSDIGLIRNLLASSLSLALRNSILFLGGLILVLNASWQLFLGIVIVVPLIVLPLIFFARGIRTLSSHVQTFSSHMIHHVQETLSSLKFLQSFVAEDYEKKRFEDHTKKRFDASLKYMKRRSLLTAISFFFGLTSIILLLWFASSLVVFKAMSGGDLLQFIFGAFISATSLGALADSWSDIQTTSAASARLNDLLSAPQEKVSTPQDISPETKNKTKKTSRPKRNSPSAQYLSPPSLTFSHVSFAYDARASDPILKDVSFVCRPGTMTALVGHSGAGKSTIFDLILGFLSPQEGSILVDKQNLASLSLVQRREIFSFVPQDPILFKRSLRENLAYGQASNATPDDIQNALRAAHIHDFVNHLPEGVETPASDRGQTFSLGQRQRLSIARALLKNSPFLLLDEITSGLDAESERTVQRTLDELRKNHTLLIAAHRLSTVQKADSILILENNSIAAGTHKELLETNDLYQRFLKLQALS